MIGKQVSIKSLYENFAIFNVLLFQRKFSEFAKCIDLCHEKETEKFELRRLLYTNQTNSALVSGAISLMSFDQLWFSFCVIYCAYILL